MSFNSWERRALARIEQSLSASAPVLVSMLAIFNRLTAGEDMPAHTRIRRRLLGWRSRRGRRQLSSPRYQQARQLRALQRLSRACLVLWVVFSVGMVTLAVVLSGVGPQTCPAPWANACSRFAHGSAPRTGASLTG
jgi:hypothetical protein